MKLVLNKAYGGFSLSPAAWALLDGEVDYSEYPRRFDEDLIDAVETLGSSANGKHANLVIVELPDTVTDYEITADDGFETILYVVNGAIYHG